MPSDNRACEPIHSQSNRLGTGRGSNLLVIISLIVLAILPGQPVLNRWVGFIFLLFLAGYMYITYVWAKHGGSAAIEVEQVDNSELTSLGKCWLTMAGGLILIVVSAEYWCQARQK